MYSIARSRGATPNLTNASKDTTSNKSKLDWQRIQYYPRKLHLFFLHFCEYKQRPCPFSFHPK